MCRRICNRQHWSVLPQPLLYFIALRCTSLRCNSLNCYKLPCTAVYDSALHCTVLHCTTLTWSHSTAMYGSTLYCLFLPSFCPCKLPRLDERKLGQGQENFSLFMGILANLFWNMYLFQVPFICHICRQCSIIFCSIS